MVQLLQSEFIVKDVDLTLPELCDAFKLNYKLVRKDYEKQVSLLTPSERETFSLNLESAIWFFTKYNGSFRFKVVKYAFNKIGRDFPVEYEAELKSWLKVWKRRIV